MEDFGEGADAVEIGFGGGFDGVFALGDDEDAGIGAEGFVEGLDGAFASDENGLDEAREQTEGAHGERVLAGFCLGGVAHGSGFEGLVFGAEGADGGFERIIRADCLGEDAIEENKEFLQGLKSVAEGFGLLAFVVGGDEAEALGDGVGGGVNFAAFTFADDAGDDGEDVSGAAVEVAAVAGGAVAFDDAPVHEFAEVHGGVAAANDEFVFDLVHAHGFIGADEEGVDLGHGAIDAPGCAHSSPFAHEEIARLEGLWRWLGARHGLRLPATKSQQMCHSDRGQNNRLWRCGGTPIVSHSESLAHVTGNRIRIQRVQDTRLLSGWVESASKGLVYLSVNQPGVLQVGDELCCECYSFKRRILLQGTIDRTLGSFENQRFLVKLANEPVVYEGSESPRFPFAGLGDRGLAPGWGFAGGAGGCEHVGDGACV